MTASQNATLAEMEYFPITIQAATFGAWKLGYANVTVTIDRVSIPGLALYAKKGANVHRRVVPHEIKMAVACMEAWKVPARSAAKLLRKIFGGAE